jgi:hypothetical protein
MFKLQVGSLAALTQLHKIDTSTCFENTRDESNTETCILSAVIYQNMIETRKTGFVLVSTILSSLDITTGFHPGNKTDTAVFDLPPLSCAPRVSFKCQAGNNHLAVYW